MSVKSRKLLSCQGQSWHVKGTKSCELSNNPASVHDIVSNHCIRPPLKNDSPYCRGMSSSKGHAIHFLVALSGIISPTTSARSLKTCHWPVASYPQTIRSKANALRSSSKQDRLFSAILPNTALLGAGFEMVLVFYKASYG